MAHYSQDPSTSVIVAANPQDGALGGVGEHAAGLDYGFVRGGAFSSHRQTFTDSCSLGLKTRLRNPGQAGLLGTQLTLKNAIMPVPLQCAVTCEAPPCSCLV